MVFLQEDEQGKPKPNPNPIRGMDRARHKHMKLTRSTFTKIALVTALCVVHGCGSDDYYFETYETAPDDPQEQATRSGADSSRTDRTSVEDPAAPLAYTNIDISTKAGQFQMELGENIRTPEELLRWVPQYSDAKILNCLKGPRAIFATYSSPNSEEHSFAFYKEESLRMGWESHKAFEIGGRRMLTSQRAGKRLTITFEKSESAEQLIHVMLSERTPEDSLGRSVAPLPSPE